MLYSYTLVSVPYDLVLVMMNLNTHGMPPFRSGARFLRGFRLSDRSSPLIESQNGENNYPWRRQSLPSLFLGLKLANSFSLPSPQLSKNF